MPKYPQWRWLPPLVLALLAGCASYDLGPRGGPGYTFNSGGVGSGEPTIVPRNDNSFMDGQPMDLRTRR